MKNLEDTFKKIIEQMSEDFPEIPLFTIHDSISTTEGYEEIVYSYLKNNLEEEIGLEPKLKLE